MGCTSSKKSGKMNVPHEAPAAMPIAHDWLNLRFHDSEQQDIIRPDELDCKRHAAPPVDESILDRVLGSMLGLALGDALGAHVEFRPRQFLLEHPVRDLQGGGTWGLNKGQFTDDTSMSLCLAASLIARHGFRPYDQLVRYKWWYRHGYMSSTGTCFDIGAATREAITEFETRQQRLAKLMNLPPQQLDRLNDPNILSHFNPYCGRDDGAGNGGLMRLAPVPLFFWRHPSTAVANSGTSNALTHGDRRAIDACRFYGALITGAMRGVPKAELLHRDFYWNHRIWFGNEPLHDEVVAIAEGSYKQHRGYDDGIRGKGFVLDSLRAALWAFWSDGDSFENGVLAAIQLGDDTDTIAAIYGQLAGAVYGSRALPERWVAQIYARPLITCMSQWLVHEGRQWFAKNKSSPMRSKI